MAQEKYFDETLSERKIRDFKTIVRKAMFLNKEENELFNMIPNSIWGTILIKNFKNNLEYAKRVVLDREDEINDIDAVNIRKEKEKIDNLKFITQKIIDATAKKTPILFLTDFDNDGSLSQSIINNYISIEKSFLSKEDEEVLLFNEYTRTVKGNSNRGITLEVVEEFVESKKIDTEKEFIVITADNGINSREEQLKIQKKYPNAYLIITDHHELENDMRIVEDEKTAIFNPKYQAQKFQTAQMQRERGNKDKKEEDYAFFEKYNISGATTIGVLLKSVIEEKINNIKNQEEYQYVKGNEVLNNKLKFIDKLSQISNVLDYVETTPEDKLFNLNEISNYVSIQSLLNINNSMEKFINNKNYKEEINKIAKLIKNVDKEKLNSICQNIFVMNKYSQIILTILKQYQANKDELLLLQKKENLIEGYKSLSRHYKIQKLEEALSAKNTKGFNKELFDYLQIIEFLDEDATNYKDLPSHYYDIECEEDKDKKEILMSKDKIIEELFLDKEDNEIKIQQLFKAKDENYIGQLRPYIFELMVNDDKNGFEKEALDLMLNIYRKMQQQEKQLLKEIRKGKIVEEFNTENSLILLVDNEALGLFNRKLINKAYNSANNGFFLTLDNIKENKISGSFRSLFDIDLIVNTEKFKEFMTKYQIQIETPGHKKAAGFILNFKNDLNQEKVKDIIKELSEVINEQIVSLKKQQDLKRKTTLKKINEEDKFIESDLYNIDFINKVNRIVRGNIPHFENISPIVKLHEDYVYVDQKTNQQISLEDYVKEHKYGYVSLLIELPKGQETSKNLIIPVELLRKLVEGKDKKDKDGFYKDYLKMNYLENGVFMVSNLIEENEVQPINKILFKKEMDTHLKIKEAFENNKLDNVVEISREELKSSPFFVYNTRGNEDFEDFENMIINILTENKVDYYVTFDVEAVGFSNAKMINLGTVNYQIDEKSGTILSTKDFKENCYKNAKNEEFYIPFNIRKISKEEYSTLVDKNPKLLNSKILYKGNDIYFVENNEEKMIHIKNKEEKGNNVIINRTIKATTLSRLIKESDNKVPIYMTYLTGINNEHINKYGKEIKEVDDFFADFYKGKDIIIGAHNTNYDLRISQANTTRFYEEVLKSNKLFDTCKFSKSETLAYDNNSFVSFKDIAEIPENILFHNNENSDINLIEFLKNGKGQYPDRTGKYRFSFENESLYLINLSNEKIEKVKISVPIHKLVQFYLDDEESITKHDLFNSYENYSTEGTLIKIETIPKNMVKFSAQALSDQKMIKNLLLDEISPEPILLNNLEEKYPDIFYWKNIQKGSEEWNNQIVKTKIELINYMLNYQFDKNDSANQNPYLKIENMTNDGIEQVKKFKRDFLEINKKLISAYSDSWYYKQILNYVDPENKDLTKDTYELISNQTGFDEKTVEKVLKQAVKFKKKYNIKHLLQKEIHVNGPKDGDVMFETPLTLLLLAEKTMIRNRYEEMEKYEVAVNIFNRDMEEFTISTILNKNKKIITEDSMGYVQLLNYNREKDNELQKEIKQKYKNLKEKNEEVVVNFKLGADTLQPQTCIAAIARKELDIDTVREDAEKIAFIMQVNQSKNKENDAYREILDNNQEKIEELKDELSKNYRYIELNSNQKDLDKLDKILFQKNKEIDLTKLKKELSVNNDLSTNDLILKAQQFEQIVKQDNENQVSAYNILAKAIEYRYEIGHKTSLEKALENNENYLVTRRDKQLHEKVNRRNPFDYMMKHFDIIDLTKNYIEYAYSLDSILKIKDMMQKSFDFFNEKEVKLENGKMTIHLKA